MSLSTFQDRLLACRMQIEGFYATLETGTLPDFGTFTDAYISLAHDLEAAHRAQPDDATLGQYYAEFETLMAYFRGLGPKLELRRQQYRDMLETTLNASRGYKDYTLKP